MVEFLKVRNVKSPVRDASENAGIDFFIPELDAFLVEEADKFGKNIEIDVKRGTITILPHGDVLIPSGIKSKFPNNLALIAFNKSGIATKKKLICGACVVDSSYEGEILVHLINTSNEPQTLEFGQKFIQFVPVVINSDELTVHDNMTDEEFYKDHESKRKTGGFGSSDLK